MSEVAPATARVIPAEPYADTSRTVAVCESCAWTGIPSGLPWHPEADARDHNAQAHGDEPRPASLLVDGGTR